MLLGRSDENKGRLAWITGGSSGIGRALALHLARKGWRVAVSARSAEALEALAVDGKGRIFACPLDVTDAQAVRDSFVLLEQEHGPVELAVLAAGTYRRDGAFNFTIERARTMIDVNLFGTMNALEPVLAAMMERRRGHVAVMASVAGYNGLPGGATYGATKAALNNLCEAMRPEAERRNVTVTVINPGFVDTPLTEKNDFPMPFLISAQEAAEAIERGLADGRYEIVFPWKMRVVIRLLHALPAGFRFFLMRRLVRDPQDL